MTHHVFFSTDGVNQVEAVFTSLHILKSHPVPHPSHPSPNPALFHISANLSGIQQYRIGVSQRM
jgi:hypothetical protein